MEGRIAPLRYENYPKRLIKVSYYNLLNLFVLPNILVNQINMRRLASSVESKSGAKSKAYIKFNLIGKLPINIGVNTMKIALVIDYFCLVKSDMSHHVVPLSARVSP